MNNSNAIEQHWLIGELSQRTGVSAKTVRYYEEAGLLPPPTRTVSGYRTYTETDAARLSFIRAAKDFGLTLGEIREILGVRDRDGVPCPYVLDLVREKLASLQDRIRRLQLLSGDLEAMVRDAEAMPAEVRIRTGHFCHVIENRRLREQGNQNG